MKPLHAASLLLALLLSPCAARAAEADAQDLADFKRIIGIDRVLLQMPQEMDKAASALDLDPAVRACLVDGAGAAITARVDANLAERLSHEVAQQWRDFAASGPGGKFVAFLNAGMAASAEGKPTPEMAAFRASLTPEEQQAIASFVLSPAGNILGELHGLTAGVDRDAITRKLQQECNVPSAPVPAR
jgi:hypothetical protein